MNVRLKIGVRYPGWTCLLPAFSGWRTDDRLDVTGDDIAQHFDASDVYLGPDASGVEPMFGLFRSTEAVLLDASGDVVDGASVEQYLTACECPTEQQHARDCDGRTVPVTVRALDEHLRTA